MVSFVYIPYNDVFVNLDNISMIENNSDDGCNLFFSDGQTKIEVPDMDGEDILNLPFWKATSENSET